MSLHAKIVTSILIISLILVAGLLLVSALAIDSVPRLSDFEALRPEDVERAKKLWQEHDPQTLLPGEIKRLVLTERDVNLVLHYASSRILPERQIRARVEFYPGTVSFRATLTLPTRIFGSYLNISGMLKSETGKLAIKELSFGALNIPRWVAKRMFASVYQHVQAQQQFEEYAKLTEAIEEIHFQQGRLLLVYQWGEELISRLPSQGQGLLLSEKDHARLQTYNAQVVKIAKRFPAHEVPILSLMQPLFRVSSQRVRKGENPIAENRILLLMLALYANKIPLRDLVESDGVLQYPSPRPVQLTLLQRTDLAKHFLVSAALTAASDSGIADALGLFKELDDARGGSGFSFADLAADRAGIHMAEMALASPEAASLLQERMGRVKHEHEFMPSIDGLPEGITALELQKQYGDLDSNAYKTLHIELERRLAACWIYH